MVINSNGKRFGPKLGEMIRLDISTNPSNNKIKTKFFDKERENKDFIIEYDHLKKEFINE